VYVTITIASVQSAETNLFIVLSSFYPDGSGRFCGWLMARRRLIAITSPLLSVLTFMFDLFYLANEVLVLGRTLGV